MIRYIHEWQQLAEHFMHTNLINTNLIAKGCQCLCGGR